MSAQVTYPRTWRLRPKSYTAIAKKMLGGVDSYEGFWLADMPSGHIKLHRYNLVRNPGLVRRCFRGFVHRLPISGQ